MIRVAIADDAFLVREAVQAVLADAGGIEVVAQWADGSALRAEIGRVAPDVVITDLRMPPGGDGEGLQIAHALRERMPGVGVIVLSQFADPRVAIELVQAGAERRGYLIKDRVGDAQALAGAIRVVARGGTVIDPGMVGGLVAPHSRLAELTPREREILALMAEGLSNAAIAQRLVITKGAVEKAVGSIFAKLPLPGEEHVSRRVAAVLLYLAD